MKKSHLLVSCAVAGLLLGSQAALADHHEEEGKSGCKSKEGKEGCQGKDGKASDDKKKDAHSCGANGCESKKEEKKQ